MEKKENLRKSLSSFSGSKIIGEEVPVVAHTLLKPWLHTAETAVAVDRACVRACVRARGVYKMWVA